jgi:hypothetical protein
MLIVMLSKTLFYFSVFYKIATTYLANTAEKNINKLIIRIHVCIVKKLSPF